MDESPFISGSQDIYSRQRHAERDMSNLMDQSLGGTAVEEEDDFGSQQGSCTRTVHGAPYMQGKGKERGDGHPAPSDIVGRASALNLGEARANQDAQAGRAQLSEAQPDNELPTEPPLYAHERRERALLEERDGLAAMNAMLDRAIHSLEGAVPKVQVGS